ncbi:MAG: hypothetical protein M3139_07505 [Bacteroidota bacterium]|nr:hypothetical protein [Bacteroidota bacterium]
MKSILILFTVICLVSFSYKKNNSSSANTIDIKGSWELKQYSGGISYQVIVPKDSIVYVFQTPGKYLLVTNNALTAAGSYEITKSPDTYHYDPEVINLLETNGNKTIYGIRLKSDSLFLSDGCCDGYNYIYTKK